MTRRAGQAGHVSDKLKMIGHDHKLSVGNKDKINSVQNDNVVPIATHANAVWMMKRAIRDGQASRHDHANLVSVSCKTKQSEELPSRRSIIFPSGEEVRTKLREPRPLKTSLSDQSGETSDIVRLPSGKVLLGRDQKPILRSDLSFRADCGVLIGPDSMTIFDEDGRPFTKRKLHVAADGKPALNEHHRLQKVEYEIVVQKKVTAKKIDTPLAILDSPVDIAAGRDGVPVTKGRVTDEHHMLAKEMRSENIVRKEIAEENLIDMLACSRELLPGSGQGRLSKISPHPFMRRKLNLDADGESALREYHRLQKMEHANVVQTKVTTKKADNLLAILDAPADALADEGGLPVNKGGVKDEHHTLARELDSESIVRKETMEENPSDVLNLGLLNELHIGDNDGSLGSDQLHVTEREQADADDQGLIRRLESENFVQKEVAQETVTHLSVCSGKLLVVGGHKRLSKISSVGSVCCFSWCCCLPSAVGGQR